MKFFSRKAIVAAATAATVAFGGVSVASAETTTPATTTATETNTPATTPAKETNTPAPTTPNKKKDESSSSSDEGSSSDMSPKEIRDWIAVFTAIIGALGTVFTFVNKYFGPNAK
ncbi:hypothetical protein ACKFRM_08510 [Corynebacterium sp. YSMAA1_1_D6]|uniref:hypothetical protein n=1 Tax=unclassified Corynebacterium TaxID=2624378 RepID=UPI002600B863|nr:hypothetical protein [uncultured Corynebacterium sp.]